MSYSNRPSGWDSLNTHPLDNSDKAQNPQDDSQAAAAETIRPTDIDCLTAVLQGFLKTRNDQDNSLTSALEKLHTAIETLKQPQSSDKMIAFWAAYKNLADEFDKEFQRKYGNDLDTSLIFAGLFSAVSSAFIIQIQPELQPDPNAKIEMLLAGLVRNMTGGTIPGIQFGGQTPLPEIVVVAQSLLYFSLFSTLLAALLSVLGKQWLLHYDSVGERGTLEERGLERQRKYDSLQRWKFDLVMQIFPLLLQLSLLLFATALSIYLWTINRPLATIVLGLTFLGSTLYITMVISALVSPDSPYQTSLTALLAVILEVPIPKSLRTLGTATSGLLLLARGLVPLPLSLLRWCPSVLSGFTIPPLLPRFNTASSTAFPQHTQIFDEIPEPSKAVPAVLWTLETSTDPRLVETAAAVIPNLQWPVNLDLRSPLRRLSDTFNGCFEDRLIRRDMGARALHCVKAFGLLELVSQRHTGRSDMWTFEHTGIDSGDSNLDSIVKYIRMFRFENTWPALYDIERFLRSNIRMTPWALRFISSQRPSEIALETVLNDFEPDDNALGDLSVLAEFLFCVNSVLAPPNAHDLSLMNKSRYCVPLITHVFTNLLNRLTDAPCSHYGIASKIVAKIIQFKNHIPDFSVRSCSNTIYRFCSLPHLEPATIISALRLLRSAGSSNLPDIDPQENITWVYGALAHLDEDDLRKEVDILIAFLTVVFRSGPDQVKPSPTALHNMLRGMSYHAEISAMTAFTSQVLRHADHWFRDDDLRPVLQDHSVWSLFGTWSPLNPDLYFALGHELSQTSVGPDVISQDLPGWLESSPKLLNSHATNDKTIQQFCEVITRVWNIEAPVNHLHRNEMILQMAFTALASAWDRFNWPERQELHRVVRLVQCTLKIVSCIRPVGSHRTRERQPSRRFKASIMVTLGAAIARCTRKTEVMGAGGDTRIDRHLKNVLNSTSDFVSKLGELAQGKSRAAKRAEIRYWRALRGGFRDDLRELFESTSLYLST